MNDELKNGSSNDSSAEDAELKEQLKIGLEILEKHAETFRALAKASPLEKKPGETQDDDKDSAQK